MDPPPQQEQHEVYGADIPDDDAAYMDDDSAAAVAGGADDDDPAAKAENIEDMKRRLKEIEEEAGALREMQAKVEKEMGASQEDPSGTSATQAEKEEADSRSIYVGNVDYACTPEEVQQHFQSCGTVNRAVKELQPAVADIGAALGLPAQGDSAETDHIYSEVLSEFTHGNHKHVSKSMFQEVLSDVLLGMADGLKRDPIVILRIDGKDLKAYIDSQRFEIEVVPVFSKLESAKASLHECIIACLEQLKVDQGMPPASDSWVRSNIVDPVLASLPIGSLKEPVTQEIALVEFKKVLQGIVQHLQEHPVIVAHSENTFDGSGTKKLLANRFELDKLLDSAWRKLPRDRKEKASKEYIRVALDGMATSAGLPPYGAIDEFDIIVNDAVKMLNADDGELVGEEEFKKMMIEILGVIMFKLEGNPIFVSSNSVVHEPIASCSTLLAPSSTTDSK